MLHEYRINQKAVQDVPTMGCSPVGFPGLLMYMALGSQWTLPASKALCSSSRFTAQPCSSKRRYGTSASPVMSSSMGRVCGQGMGVSTPV